MENKDFDKIQDLIIKELSNNLLFAIDAKKISILNNSLVKNQLIEIMNDIKRVAIKGEMILVYDKDTYLIETLDFLETYFGYKITKNNDDKIKISWKE